VWRTHSPLSHSDQVPFDRYSCALSVCRSSTVTRTVIITQGPNSTVAVSEAVLDNPKVIPVTRLEDGQIVDTNGAGDAFAGGFLGALVSSKTLDEAVLAGHKLGAMCVQLVSALKTPTFLFHESAAGRTAVPLAEGGRVVDMVFTMVGTLST